MPLIDLTARWYRLMYPCPRCGRRPAFHVSGAWMVLILTMEPEQPLVSYQCQRETCRDPRTRERTTFLLAADAFQRAELVDKAAA